MTAYLADLWGQLCQISNKNLTTLALTVIEKFHPNPRRQHCWRFFRSSFRQEVANNVISSGFIEYVAVDVRVKFGISRSIHSQGIRTSHFLMDDDDEERTMADVWGKKRMLVKKHFVTAEARTVTSTIALSENSYAFRLITDTSKFLEHKAHHKVG